MLLILVVMWVAVLLPPYLRNRGGSGAGSSMNSFRRKLDTLERTSPFPGSGSKGHVSAYLPVNANSVNGPQPLDGPLPAGSRHPLQGGGPRLVPMPAAGVQVVHPLAAAPEIAPEDDATYLLAPAADVTPRSEPDPGERVRNASPSTLSARAARKRRRDVLYTLLAACGLTLVMGIVLGGPVLLLHLLCDAALAGYVYLLVTMQKAKAERDIKVAFLPHQNHDAEPSRLLETGGGWQPGELLRRSAN